MVSERRIFCFRLRYPYTVGINFEEKYRLLQERKKEMKVIMKDTLLYLHIDIRCTYQLQQLQNWHI